MTVQEFIANGGTIKQIAPVEFKVDQRVRVRGQAWVHDKRGDKGPRKFRG